MEWFTLWRPAARKDHHIARRDADGALFHISDAELDKPTFLRVGDRFQGRVINSIRVVRN